MLILTGTLLSITNLPDYTSKKTGVIYKRISVEVLDVSPGSSIVRQFRADLSAFESWKSFEGKMVSFPVKTEKDYFDPNKTNIVLFNENTTLPVLAKSVTAA